MPNIAGSPGGIPVTRDPAQAAEPRGPIDGLKPGAGQAPSFDAALKEAALKGMPGPQGVMDGAAGGAVKSPLKFSAHATSRLASRGIEVGAEQMRKLGEAVDKAASKGLDDTLILTKDAAFIVSVRNRTVVTAMDRSQMEGNVFTNIEGAIIVT